MAPKIMIAPSILSADFARLGEEVQAVEAAGAGQIHVDVMDGHFVPNLTMGPVVVEALRRVTDLPLDVHLMIEQPERYLVAIADAGANVLTVHIEVATHIHRTLQRIRELGLQSGVALNPGTPVSTVGDVVGELDLLLVMTVNPGFGGQQFIEGSIDKVKEARALLDANNPRADLSVDGGIGLHNAERVASAGANVFVAGSSLFNASNGAGEAVKALQAAVEG